MLCAMRAPRSICRLAALPLAAFLLLAGCQAAHTPAPPVVAPVAPHDEAVVRRLVGQLELGRYKATIKSLTQFGDRRQGTDRNRAAID